MKKRCLAAMLVMMMVISPLICVNLFAIIGMNSGYAFALEPDRELRKVRVGEVTAFTGEVFVRVNGRWSQLTQVPQTLYSSDKVVTRRGRAEISFVDGGILRLDLDTNISIRQDIQRTKTLFSEKAVTSKQVNVLLGKLWFDVKIIEKESSLKFKTPSMTSFVQSASGKIEVKPDGTTYFGLVTGGSENEGKYEFISNPKEITNSDIVTDVNKLPESDPEADKSDMQTLAKQSVSREEATKRAKEDADARIENTKGKNDPAALALEAAAKADAEAAKANAAILSAEEILEEAKRFGDKDVIAKAEKMLDGVMKLADNAANAAQEAAKMSSAALSATTLEEKESYAATAMAYGSAAEANANAVSAAVNVAEIAVSDDDTKSVKSAEGEVEKAKNQAVQAAKAAKNAGIMAEMAKNARNEESRQAATAAASASESAASASAAASRANAVVAEALSAKNIRLVMEAQDTAAKAEDNAKEANRLALIAFEYAKKTTDAVSEEERKANVAVSKAYSSAAKANESAAKAYSLATKAYAEVSDELISGDEKSLRLAKQQAADLELIAGKASKAADDAKIAADRGDFVAAEAAAKEAAGEVAKSGGWDILLPSSGAIKPTSQTTGNIPLSGEPPVNDREPASPY